MVRAIAVVSLAVAGTAAHAATSAVNAGKDRSVPRLVLGTANIFGAGYGDAPAPGGGGGGTAPPGWRLPAGSGRVVTFPRITGTVTPINHSAPYNGPEGDGAAGLGPTDVESWRGISGIVDAKNGMFLVGVFVGDSEPALPPPLRLEFTDRERFGTLVPRLGQTFFVGDGGSRRYEVPQGASRLYLGFADADFYRGKPGFYGNNAGHLEVVASGVLDDPEHALDITAPELSGAWSRAVTARRGTKLARVRFSVTAIDAVDGTLPVTCVPRSGSFFRIGRTKVSCSATDWSANAARATFTVTVRKGKR